MLYYLFYWLLILAIPLYFSHFYISKKRKDWSRKPKARLFTVNHTNSFVDPIIIAANLPFPTWFLARGDALQGKLGRFIAKSFYIMPVWREREGNVRGNYDTFERCMEIWKGQGSVMIFVEGLCENDWRLKPFPKGTARLVWQAWQQGITLEIIPTGVNYEHFSGPGKQCEIRYGAPMVYTDLLENTTEAIFYRKFNERLFALMQPLVIEATDAQAALHQFTVKRGHGPLANFLRKLAKLMHWPYYSALRSLAKRAKNTVHYDAALFGMLLLSYPVFLLVLMSMFLVLGLPGLWLLTFVWPFMAWLGR
ncbi:MAG: 1-acyl-sn-glycerol-3-phosphate acyltransferase [Bacteroidia bacterium]